MLSVALAMLVAAPTIDLAERRPVAVFVVDASRGTASIRTSEVLEVGDGLLMRDTDLRLVSVEQLGADVQEMKRCPHERRISCWAQETLRGAGERAPLHLLIVSPLPRPDGGADVATIWIDLGVAAKLLETRDRGAEDRLFRSALVDTHPVAAARVDRRVLRNVLEATFRRAYARTTHWMPFGTILLRAPANADLRIDNRAVTWSAIGTSTVATLRLRGLRSGSHTIVAAHNGRRSSVDVQVRAGRTTPAAITIAVVESPPNAPIVAAAAGGAIAAVGVALMIFAATSGASESYAAACPSTGCPPRGDTAFLRSCQLGDVSVSCAKSPSGPLVVPLGAALVALGGATSAGAWWFESEHDFPWRSILVGLAAGLAIYGAAEVFGGGQPLGGDMP